MATRSISRSIPRLLTRSFASSAPLSRTPVAPSLLSRSRPLSVAGHGETILLDGCDFEHWLVVVDPPQGDLTRDEIIDGYIKTLAQIVGSEEEARMKIYSVSHRCYFAFGALVSEDLSHKLKELPNVRWVLPDSYLDTMEVRLKGREPFIDGRAVPYDHKYHEEWIRNNARANDKNKRNDRPRNFDKRRRDNMSAGFPPQRPPMGRPPPPQNYGGPPPPPNNMGGQRPPPNYGGAPPQNYMGGQRPPANYGGAPPQTNMGGAPQPNYGGAPPQNNMGGGPPPNAGWSGNNNNYQQQSGGMQQPQYQNNYPPNRDGSGNPYQG
ncbi:hypothetical protein Bca4012_090714 [Brassica carinata]|uniref:MORF/ORRM1/DAG-like MORF domain-containing protein n=1 Tax=Brassica carinata TaxID=52824 RepID=A0A8X7TM89_BRACI|nr:hypothetical protein Bca52824_085929 [Brassica carinata]